MPPAERPTVDRLTEAGILSRLLPQLAPASGVEVGPGDDAAVLRWDAPRLVISTDTLTEGQDFLLAATRPEWIGTKAAVQNLADIAAMGARPRALVVALVAPRTTLLEDLDAISAAISVRAQRDGAGVVGGDLGAGDALSITVTVLGELDAEQDPITRSGALPGDVVAIGSPALGRSAAGLSYVLASRHHEQAAADLVAWHNAPDPDLTLGWTAARDPRIGHARAHAMIDVSDSLTQDAGRIAAASGVIVDLDASSLRADADALAEAADQLGADPWDWVLHGGEEHALLATFPATEPLPRDFRRIGTVHAVQDEGIPAGTVLLDGARLRGEDFDHFA